MSGQQIIRTLSFDSILGYIKEILLEQNRSVNGDVCNEVDNGQLEEFLKDFCIFLKHYHKLELKPEDFYKFKFFSVFRNFQPNDLVFKPIERRISIDEYLDTFQTTNLLSLNNHTRYTKEFCLYIRSLFGNNANQGLMGPFQYMRLLVVFLILAQGTLRTKLFQVSLNLVGTGSNGKSLFLWMLKRCLGDKMATMQSKVMFGNTSETHQQAIGLEEAMFVYDQDADFVDLNEFKKGVADIENLLKRRLYHGLDRTGLNYTTPLFSSNTPIRYTPNKVGISFFLLLFFFL